MPDDSTAIELQGAIEDISHLKTRLAILQSEEGFVDALRLNLGSAERRLKSLIALQLLDAKSTELLLPEVLALSLSHRDALHVRELLGRLPRPYLDEHLPPLVDELLLERDYDTFRRMAELLRHLGLDTSLTALLDQAQDDPDPEIREVANDFRD